MLKVVLCPGCFIFFSLKLNTISTYIFKRLCGSLLMIGPVIIMVVWLTISIRYINFIITDNIDPITFCKMILCALPDILTMIIPLCFLISGMHVLHRLRSDQELIVMMTSGKSTFALARPIILFALLLSVIMFHSQANLTPFSHKNMETIQRHMKNKISMSIIRSGVFNVLGNSVIYIGSKTDNSLDNIFISYIPSRFSNKTNIITAKSGIYNISQNKMFIVLINGFRQVIGEDHNVISTMKFKEFSYDVTDFMKRYTPSTNKPHEKTQKELFESANSTQDREIRAKYLAEAYGRYITSASPLIAALCVSIFLIIANNRGNRFRGLIKTFVSGLIIQLGLISLVNLSRKIEGFITYEFIITFSIFVVLFIIAFRKRKI